MREKINKNSTRFLLSLDFPLRLGVSAFTFFALILFIQLPIRSNGDLVSATN